MCRCVLLHNHQLRLRVAYHLIHSGVARMSKENPTDRAVWAKGVVRGLRTLWICLVSVVYHIRRAPCEGKDNDTVVRGHRMLTLSGVWATFGSVMLLYAMAMFMASGNRNQVPEVHQ